MGNQMVEGSVLTALIVIVISWMYMSFKKAGVFEDLLNYIRHELLGIERKIEQHDKKWVNSTAALAEFVYPIIRDSFYNYDARGVRAFVGYQSGNGCWSVEVFRKKTKEESEGDHDWKMVRVGHIQSYDSRVEAELKALEIAKDVCEEFGY